MVKLQHILVLGASGLLALPALSQTVAPAAPPGSSADAGVARGCPVGRTEVDRENHCCLPGQAWSGGRCSGVPTSCAPGESFTSNGMACATRACEAGEVRVSDRCCAAGQRWNDDDHRCDGNVARCPEGQVRQGEACVPSSVLRAAQGAAAPTDMVATGGGVFRRAGAVVVLGPFAIDRREVSVGQYRRCVTAGACVEAQAMFGVDARDDAPVVNVSWEMARRYCAYAGGRLPTEAEWEFAARGTDGRRYPWGERLPDCSIARFNGCGAAPLRVEGHPGGASPLGLTEMAGNVAEWVSDWSAALPSDGVLRDPTGPLRGTQRVIRGGSFVSSPAGLEASARGAALPDEGRFDTGFRCARGR